MTVAVAQPGVSGAAQYIATNTSANCLYLHESSALGVERVIRGELAEVWQECRERDWDGHGAVPVERETFENARAFLQALPLGYPQPTIGAEPDGQLTVEWYRNPRRVLSVSVADNGRLHFAALLGATEICGTETFYGEFPSSIQGLIWRVHS